LRGADIAGDASDRAARHLARKLGYGSGELVRLAAVEGHGGASGGQALGDGVADALGGARHQRRLALEVDVHGAPIPAVTANTDDGGAQPVISSSILVAASTRLEASRTSMETRFPSRS